MSAVLLQETMEPRMFAQAVLGALLEDVLVIPMPPKYAEKRALRLRDELAPLAKSGVLFSTSGTVDDSKFIVRSAQNVQVEAEGVAAAMGLNRNSRVLITSPITHSFGFGVLVACATVGAEAVTLTSENVFSRVMRARQLLIDERFDVVTGVPFMFRRLLRNPIRLSSQTVSYVGGETVPRSLIWQWTDITGSHLFQEYGLSETGIVSIGRMGLPANSIGLAVPGCFVAIDQHGELIVWREDNPTSYLKGESPETFREVGAIYTGDLGYDRPDGSLYLVGRRKSIVIIGGNKVVPEEVEAVIQQFPGVEDVVVFGRSQPDRETRLVAYVAPALNHSDRNELTYRLRQVLEAYKVPHIDYVNTLPHTASGKVDRGAVVRL